jgi:hypothetical protein
MDYADQHNMASMIASLRPSGCCCGGNVPFGWGGATASSYAILELIVVWLLDDATIEALISLPGMPDFGMLAPEKNKYIEVGYSLAWIRNNSVGDFDSVDDVSYARNHTVSSAICRHAVHLMVAGQVR